MKKFLAHKELATWRRMNGFDRVVEGEEIWFYGHRLLPPTPQEYPGSLRHELQKLKDAISMPNEKFARPKWPVEKRGCEDEEPRQKTMDVVDGRRSNFLDGLLANFEFARIKEYVEKRSRDEAAQAQVTVTPVDTVQHSSPCSPDLEPSSRVYVMLENSEAKMGPELEELESPSAGTGLETPGQQCPPNKRIWETERTTAADFLTAGAGSCQSGNISSLTERVKSTRITADITFLQQGHKPRSEKNKQFDPGGEGEKAPPWNAAVTLLFFWGELEGSLLVVDPVCTMFVLCFLNYCFLSRWPLLSEAERHEGTRGSSR